MHQCCLLGDSVKSNIFGVVNNTLAFPAKNLGLDQVPGFLGKFDFCDDDEGCIIEAEGSAGVFCIAFFVECCSC